jgi:tetratricopeptide (TPR) repeat protein
VSLAVVADLQGRDDEAEGWYLRALAKLDRPAAPGQTSPDLAWHPGHVAGFYRRRGEYEKAKALFQRAEQAARRPLGERHPLLAQLQKQQEALAVLRAGEGQ